MSKKLNKTEVKKHIKEFFSDIKNKTPKEIKKIKRFAMRHNIKLGELRKKFCKKCLMPYKNPKIKMRKGMKSIICENCEYVSRWKI